MASAGLAVVVFLLGVMVGRGESILDVVTGQQAAGAGGEESLVVEDQPFFASTTRREPSMAATDGADLSYFQRLDDDVGAELDARLLERSAPGPVAEGIAGDDASGSGRYEMQSGGSARRPVGRSPATGSRARSGGYAIRSGGYAIQVTTLRESAAAERLAQGLVEKGYPAFVVRPAPGVPVQVFRVRVGTYAGREEAEQVLRRLEAEESFKPWITR